MHYADGTKAAHGDLVVRSESSGDECALIITKITEAETCNGLAFPVAKKPAGSPVWSPIVGQSDWYVTLKECRKVS